MTEYEYTDADAPPPEDGTRLPAHDELAEQSVLGAMMLSTTAVDDVIDVAHPSDFYLPKHETIARAIGRVREVRREPVDAITVVAELERAGELARVGGAAYIHTLTSVVLTAANAGFYAERVHELAVRRRLVVAGQRLVQSGYASEGTVEDLLDRARQDLESVTTVKRRLHMIGDGFPELFDQLAEQPLYYPSPWSTLNKIIDGFAPGTLTVVAARPGAGKSIATLQMAASLARHGVVALSSLEMTEAELQKRLLAQFGDVHMTALRTHTLSREDWQRAATARQRAAEAPIFVDDTPAVSMIQIRSHARQVARRGKLAGVVIDYLQLVTAEGQSRQEQVAAVSRAAKQLAKDLDVPVIAAAQLRRMGERRGSKLPGLDDLRESGAIEQDADVVILLDRDREKRPHALRVVVAKNRHGELGKVELVWEAQYARLRDKAWTPLAGLEMD